MKSPPVVFLALLGACSSAPDLPDDWDGASSVTVNQSACTGSAQALTQAMPRLELAREGATLRAIYRDAQFRCSQQVCAYRLTAGETAKVLVQPCDMDPSTVARCDCLYDVGFAVDGSPAVVGLYRRWDKYGRTGPNDPQLVDQKPVPAP